MARGSFKSTHASKGARTSWTTRRENHAAQTTQSQPAAQPQPGAPVPSPPSPPPAPPIATPSPPLRQPCRRLHTTAIVDRSCLQPMLPSYGLQTTMHPARMPMRHLPFPVRAAIVVHLHGASHGVALVQPDRTHPSHRPRIRVGAFRAPALMCFCMPHMRARSALKGAG